MAYRGYFVEFIGLLNTMIWQTLSPPYQIVKSLADAGIFSFLSVVNIVRLHFRLHFVKLLGKSKT
jgi:hypothetical protein